MQSKLFFLVLPFVGSVLSAALPVADADAAPAPVAEPSDDVKHINLADFDLDDVINKDDVETRAVYVKKAAIPEPKIPKVTTTTKPKPSPTPTKKPTPSPTGTGKGKGGLGSACTVM